MSQADRTADNVKPLFRPVSYYDSPGDVFIDDRLSTEEKRVILSLTKVERCYVERRLAEELRGRSVPPTTMEGIDVC
jgi:hypothetical protein